MSQVAIRDQNERTSIQKVAFGQGAGGGMLAPQNLGDIVRFAEVMARADVAIPKHLRDNPGACLAVCMQAFKWEMDPFSVAQKSYKVGDQMAYEAQLIAAVINTRAGLTQRPKIEFEGEGASRRCIVTFEASDGSTHVYRSPSIHAITPKNSPLWKSDPDQQLGYYSVRAGARRHFPEVILGVYDREELVGSQDMAARRAQGRVVYNVARPNEQIANDAAPEADASLETTVDEAAFEEIDGDATEQQDETQAQPPASHGSAPDGEASSEPPPAGGASLLQRYHLELNGARDEDDLKARHEGSEHFAGFGVEDRTRAREVYRQHARRVGGRQSAEDCAAEVALILEGEPA